MLSLYQDTLTLRYRDHTILIIIVTFNSNHEIKISFTAKNKICMFIVNLTSKIIVSIQRTMK